MLTLLLIAATMPAAELTPAERGRKALFEKSFIPGFWPKPAYGLAWKSWGIDRKPADYDAAFRDRYGFAEAPYPNDGLPMGLRLAPYLPIAKGIGIDCMTCHAGGLMGKGVVGLGNASLDIQALFEDMAAAGEMPVKLPFTFSNVRGTSEAGAFSVFLLGYRNDDLTLRDERRDLGLHDDACEDVPAWWLLKKKKTMYYIGATDARSVRSIMQFMMHPLSLPTDFEKAEPHFKDIQSYINSIEPPKYPFPIDSSLAASGKTIFENNCAKCHGTYGENAKYPNKIIPLDEIGTDRKRYDNIGDKFAAAYRTSWFAKEPGITPGEFTNGYQAPPLDGIWATAPYFHNGSVPTIAGVLNSKARPKAFTRSFQTAEADYDKANVGWKVTEPPATKPASGFERRKIYDTTQPGRGNSGHTFGDNLTDAERKAVIEYLKTL